ncbi:Sec1 family domain-containing protein MIP3 [Dichanthelium oligosanthes]|uniref:Sec1 family domain-containing protein MIP3 n=1 Tax=Dichanthelium oligosanthes TaxID=888268 RepID=A0A1E5VQM4_9POAL|nr:Sec1 family domain-containing protein MIP3 [Dichanthelium oligosanthes]
MGSVDLIAACLDSIRQIGDEIADTIVYVDAGTLEAFQFIGAFPLLVELGARAVCSLENTSPLDAVPDWHSKFSHPVRKIVVLTSRLLSDAHRYILRCLGNHGTVSHCTVLTAISEIGHSAYIDSPLGPDAFREYETLLVQDHEELFKKCEKSIKHKDSYTGSDFTSDADKYSEWGSGVHYGSNSESSPTKRNLFDGDLGQLEASGKRLSVTVSHFPMIFSPISSRAFVLPSEGIIADSSLSNQHEDSLGPGLPSISTGKPFDSDEVPPGVTLTAQFLYHLANKMDLKLDIFSLGDTSKVIGKLMMDMSSLYDVGRNKRSAGLLIVDRTVDLLTPCIHGDSFLDRMLSSLPRKERMSSSFSVAENPQTPGKHSHTAIKRVPLDIKVPFETVFKKEEPKSRTSMLSEGIMSFMSGWNSAEVDSEVTWLPDYSNKAHDDRLDSELGTLSGSLLSNYAGVRYLEALLDRGSKDGLMLIKKWLIEALQHEKLSSASKGRQGATSVSEIHSMVQMLSRDQLSLLRNRGVIQLALAAEMTLLEPQSSRWDAFTSAERILSVTSAETTQSLASELRDFINTSTSVDSHKQATTMEPSQGLLSFQDVLLLTIIGYILAGENFPTSIAGGPFSWEDERSLKDVVVDSILERPSSVKLRFLDGLDNELEAKARSKDVQRNNKDSTEPASSTDDFDDEWGNWDDNDNADDKEEAYGDMQLKLEVRDRVDQLFKLFHKLSSMRLRNQALGEGLVALSRFETDSYSRKGLLYKLLLALLSRYDVPGLEYHSSAVGRLFKSGLGRFGLGQSKPGFGDQSVLIIFVVGGINTLEVREVMKAISESSRPDVELILGGTTLLTPDDMFELMLGS